MPSCLLQSLNHTSHTRRALTKRGSRNLTRDLTIDRGKAEATDAFVLTYYRTIAHPSIGPRYMTAKKQFKSCANWVPQSREEEYAGEEERRRKRGKKKIDGEQGGMINTLRHTATHYNTLQHTATHCSTRQHTCNARQQTLHHAAIHCTTLQLLHHKKVRSES